MEEEGDNHEGSGEEPKQETKSPVETVAPPVNPAETVTYMCVECGQVLSSAYSLKRHSLTHTGEKPHACNFCDKRFAHAYRLTEHLNVHIGDKLFQCVTCGKDFSKAASLKRHMVTHHKKAFVCQHCQTKLENNDDLDEHLVVHHNMSRSHMCVVCGKYFTCEDILEEHIRSHLSDVDAMADEEENIISVGKDQEALTRPEKSVQSPYFAAKTAVVSVKKNNAVRKQTNTAKTPKKNDVTCIECGKSFSRPDSLRRHLVAIHSNNNEIDVNQVPQNSASLPTSGEDAFSCEKCGMCFPCGDLLRQHQLIVHQVAIETKDNTPNSHPAEGSQEKSTTDTKANTATDTNHSAGFVADGDEPTYCISCKTNFTDMKDFEKHLLTCRVALVDPTENKINSPGKLRRSPRKCPHCSKQFVDNYCLRRHMISHTGEKRHECTTCGKKFAHSFHLNNHNKIHLGIKNFRCDICGKSFTVNHALQRHLLTHPSTVAYSCFQCNKKFASEAGLRKHELIHLKQDI